MFIESNGTLVRKGIEFVNSDGSAWNYGSWRGLSVLSERWSSYGQIYKSQLWVSVLVNKLAKAQARLPLPVYQRNADGTREQVRDHPYARLLRNPSSKHDPFMFYQWTTSTLETFGASAWGKLRDAGGRPRELVLLHPSGLRRNVDRDTGVVTWTFNNGIVQIDDIPDHDIVYFHTYNPDDPSLGLSPLEPLRATLENEDSARQATSSFWANGARPGVALTHPGNLSTAAAKRLKVAWNEIAAGADKTGGTIVLEEGMKAETMTLTAEEAQYIESRRLNREEVCAAYDVPPPVVHILDRATFSNITEQMRSMYRDTMAPRLGYFESVLEAELRSSRRPGASEPDFGDDVYAEYLLDEVLRGDFEVRTTALVQLVGSGQMTPNEARRIENRPAMDGGDELFVNAAMVPLSGVIAAMEAAAAAREAAAAAAEAAAQAELEDDEDDQGDDVEEETPKAVTAAAVKELPADVVRSVMGRLSRPAHPYDVDPDALVAGLNGHTKTVLGALTSALLAGDDMPALRDRIRALAAKER